MEERLPQKPDDASKALDSVPFPHGASWFIVDDMARTLFFTAVAFSLAHICVFALFSTMYIEVGRQKTAAIALCEVQMKRAQSRCEVKTSSLQANITNLTSANAICKFETARLEARRMLTTAPALQCGARPMTSSTSLQCAADRNTGAITLSCSRTTSCLVPTR